MKRTIGVYVGDATRRVGTLLFERQGRRQNAVFEYDREWLNREDRFALEPGLPLVAGPQFHKARSAEASIFPGPIADTEPDGWARRVILRDHAKRRQAARAQGRKEASLLTPIDFLLAVDDTHRVGALRFQDEDGVFQRAPIAGRRTTPPLIELRDLLAASKAVETHTDTEADLAYLRGRGTSLGGQRPKCSVIDDDGILWVGKFPSVDDDRAVTKGEVLALRLARAAGIDAANARLVDSDGVPVALVRRFDRTREGRLMYVSAATLLGEDAADVIDTSGTIFTYTQIIDAIRQHGADAQTDIRELWRRIAFSILITNLDDHLRNHGFLHSAGGRWRLSPAFDVNPSPERVRDLTTWISEDVGPQATIDALMSIAPYCRLERETAVQILAQTETAVARWRAVGRELGMTTAELDQYADAFEHSERDAARALASSHRRAGIEPTPRDR